MDEQQAQFILKLALANNQAAEMLNCLFEGGAITINPIEKRLVTLTAEQVKAMQG